MIPSPDDSAAVPAGRLAVDVDLRAGQVALGGALTGSDCHHLDDAWSALSGGAHPAWLLDLAGLTGCDAAGVRALREAPRTAADAGAVLIISTVQPGLRRLLAIAGLGGLLAPRANGREKGLSDGSGIAAHQDAHAAEQADGDDSGCGQPAHAPREPAPSGTRQHPERTGRRGSIPLLSPAPNGGVRRAHDPHPANPEPIRLAAVGRRLIGRGCTADLADVGIAEDADIRLLVGRTNGPVSVEVLGPCDGANRRDRWCAVRIDPDGIPCVWAGPARTCPTDALVAFVEALLGTNPQQAAGHYLPLG